MNKETRQQPSQGAKELLYQCPICGLKYKDKAIQEKCTAWCSKHKSCNIEIIKQAVQE